MGAILPPGRGRNLAAGGGSREPSNTGASRDGCDGTPGEPDVTRPTQLRQTVGVVSTGSFDEHHPPSTELLADCVHCGFCLPACPTYALWANEMDSPRGRIYLMQLGVEERAPLDEDFTRHIDTCLGCMACVTACPSGVQYDRLIEATRSQVERQADRSIFERLFRRLIFSLFPYPKRLRVVALKLWVYQTSGLQWLVRASGLLKVLPPQLRAMEAVTPPVALKSVFGGLSDRVPASGTTRRRVALLLGCVQRTFFPDVNAATARVLAAEGCEVIVPPDQGCCGALMVHAGLEADAISMAKRLVDTFDGVDVDEIVVNAAGCGSTLKEYGHLLRDEPEYADRGAKLAAKCRDISEVLADLPPRAPRHPIPMTVAYHDACHLQHAQGVTAEPRQVLGSIPDLQILEIPESGLCCGSAGIYNLVEPETARQLGSRKAANVQSTGADAVVSSNPGCLLQLQSSMKEATDTPKATPPMYHMVEVLDASIRGVSLSRGTNDVAP